MVVRPIAATWGTPLRLSTLEAGTELDGRHFAPSILTTDNTDFGWDIGGGVFIFLGERVGVRGDIRHFHSFDDLSIAGIPLGDTKRDFGRASAALVFKS